MGSAERRARKAGRSDRWWLTTVKQTTCCAKCARVLRAGDDMVYRPEPREARCLLCAEALSYRPSVRWEEERATEVRRRAPKQAKKPVTETPAVGVVGRGRVNRRNSRDDPDMSDTGIDYRARIVTLADQALETSIAHQLTNWTALTALVAKVAEPGGHLDQAIDLLVDRRSEAVTIARTELEQLTEAERERFELAAARRTAMAMMVAADMLARTGALFDAPDVYDMPPHVVAAVGATLTTSGLLKDAVDLIHAANPLK
jgi:hypothetical protein